MIQFKMFGHNLALRQKNAIIRLKWKTKKKILSATAFQLHTPELHPCFFNHNLRLCRRHLGSVYCFGYENSALPV